MRTVVLDASVLVACLFKDGHARSVLVEAEDVTFVAPPGILGEAEAQLPRVAARSGTSRSEILATLELLRAHVHEVSLSMLRPFEERAKAVARRAGDPNDWEYVALAWALDAPIWTYDHDFRRMEGVRVIDTASIRARH